MRKVFWTIGAISAFLGGFLLLYAIAADSAPQQAGAAAIAIGLAVIPYCFNRALDEFDRKSVRTDTTASSERLLPCWQCDQAFPAAENECPSCGATRRQRITR